MDGETFYRNKHAARYRPVWRDFHGAPDAINRKLSALQDLDTGVLRTSPAELLEEAGIKVEEYQRYPHKLVVLPETLRAARIPLEDFVLV